MNSSLWRETPDFFILSQGTGGEEDRASLTGAQFNSAVNVSDAQRCLSKRFFFSRLKKLIEPLLETNGQK